MLFFTSKNAVDCSGNWKENLLAENVSNIFSKLKNTVGICQQEHAEFKMLRCNSKESGSKAGVLW